MSPPDTDPVEGRRDLAALPKTDLHVHLEGSVRATTVAELADRHGTELPSSLRDGAYRFADFADFIRQYTVACACLRDPEDFERIAYEFCQDEAALGVRWAEVSVSLPEHGLNNGDWDGPLEGVLGGLATGGRDFGIQTRIEIDAVRGFPIEASERAMRQALRYRDRGVISLGLGGSERFPPEPYADIFREAVLGGLHSTPHAGEAEGPASIRGALDALGAERIGHGIRILEDPDLTAEIRDRKIPLEVCPSSNVATGVVASIEDHPLPRLLEAGLLITLNSDDPAMFGSPVAGEYEVARTTFGMDDAALAALARAGVRASFADASTKSALEREIDGWLSGDTDMPRTGRAG